MKKIRLLLLVALIAMVVFGLTACGKQVADDDDGNTVQFTITFDTQGGSKVKSIKVSKGSTITLPSAPTKDGYVFDGWYLDRDCIEVFDDHVSISKNIKLYAKWIEDGGDGPGPEPQVYTITFIVDGTNYDTLELREGATLTLPTDPAKTCWLFDGWYVDEDCIKEIISKELIAQRIQKLHY